MNEIKTADRAEALRVIDELDTLSRLGSRLTERGTRPSRGLTRKIYGNREWFDATAPTNRRSWKSVAYRWLRRYVGGEWRVGGHHIGRPNGGPAIGERPAGRLDAQLTNIRVDGRPVTLGLIR